MSSRCFSIYIEQYKIEFVLFNFSWSIHLYDEILNKVFKATNIKFELYDKTFENIYHSIKNSTINIRYYEYLDYWNISIYYGPFVFDSINLMPYKEIKEHISFSDTTSPDIILYYQVEIESSELRIKQANPINEIDSVPFTERLIKQVNRQIYDYLRIHYKEINNTLSIINQLEIYEIDRYKENILSYIHHKKLRLSSSFLLTIMNTLKYTLKFGVKHDYELPYGKTYKIDPISFLIPIERYTLIAMRFYKNYFIRNIIFEEIELDIINIRKLMECKEIIEFDGRKIGYI